jgi:drug/metabolite transporter (DMT)-like permease
VLSQKLRSRSIGYLCAFLAAALFGSISTVAKPALSNVNPILLSALIYLLAFLLLTPVAKVNDSRRNNIESQQRARKNWVLIIAIAVSGAIIAPSLYFIGLVNAKASDTAVLSNAEVVFTVLIAIAIFKERFKPIGYFAIALVLAGVFIVTTNLDFASLSISDLRNKGTLLIIASMVFWAIDNNLSKLASRRIEVARLVQLKSVIGGSVLMIFVIISAIPFSTITLTNLPNILLLGLGGVGASLFFFLHSMKRIGTTRTMLIYSTSSIFGLILATVFLKESIGVYQIAAAAMMLIGIYLIETSEAAKEI